MAIAFDTSQPGSNWGTGDPQEWTHTCTGSDLILYVYVFWGGAGNIINDVTYNGVSMTLLSSQSNDAQPGSGNSHAIYYLFNPATGSNTVSVDLTSSTNIAALSASYTGVDSGNAPGFTWEDGLQPAGTSYTTTAITPDFTTDWLIGAIRNVDNRTVSNDTMTSLRQSTTTVILEWHDTNGTIGTTSSTTTDYTVTSSGRLHGSFVIKMSAAGGSSASSSPSSSVSASPSASPSSSPSPSVSASPSSSPSSSVSSSPSASPSSSPSAGTNWTLLADAKANGLVSATTAGIDTTGAELLIIGVACADNWDGTPTDSKSNTWTEVTQSYSNNQPRVRLFYSVPTSVGTAHTVTADEDGALDDLVGTVFFAAFSHTSSTDFTEDQINGATDPATASSLATGSITPSEDGTLIIAGYAVNGTGATPISIDSGFTEIDEQDFVSGTSYGGALAYLDQTTAAAINPTWTRSNINGQAAIITSFKIVPGSSPSSSPSPSVSSSPSSSVSSSPSPSVSASPSASPSSSPSPSVSSSPSSSPSPSVSSSPSSSVSSSPSASSSPSSSPSSSVSSSPSSSTSSSPSPSVSASPSSSPSTSPSSSVSSSPSSSPSSGSSPSSSPSPSVSSSPSPSVSASPSTSPSTSVSASASSSPSASPSPFIWIPVTRNSY